MSNLANDFSEKLDSILSNPDMMAQIKRLADTMTSGTPPISESPPPEKAVQAGNFGKSKDSPPDGASDTPDIAEAVGALTSLSGEHRDRRKGNNLAHSRALLLALKPYLDGKRGEKIDKLLRMMQLAEMAGYFM